MYYYDWSDGKSCDCHKKHHHEDHFCKKHRCHPHDCHKKHEHDDECYEYEFEYRCDCYWCFKKKKKEKWCGC